MGYCCGETPCLELTFPVSDQDDTPADYETTHPTCYFPNLSRQSAVILLSSCPIGSYLIRPSTSPLAFCTISVRAETQILHMRILRTANGQLFVDATSNSSDKYFQSLCALLYYYSSRDTGLSAELMDSRATLPTFFMSNPIAPSEVKRIPDSKDVTANFSKAALNSLL